MEELKIIGLVITLCFVTSLTATTKNHNPFYPNSVKGGLQTSQKYDSGKLPASGKAGNRDQRVEKSFKNVKIISRCNKN